MSRRDGRDERERASRAQQAAQARTNEYFVPRDGIDREVITADICRYLGNDALVRPGNYENPTTRQVQQGYFITAYRNLTTAMIADLKADSERWEAERRQTASRGQPSNVEYRASTTHQSRQYYGPTEAAPAGAPGGYPPTSMSSQQGVYGDTTSQYQSYSQPMQTYSQSQYATSDNNSYYVAGSDMRVDTTRTQATRTSVPQQTTTVPRSGPQYGSVPNTIYQQQQQPDPQSTYYPNQTPVSSVGYPAVQQPQDPFYGRAAPQAGTYGDSTMEIYDAQYQDPRAYGTQPGPVSSTSSTTATSGSSRRDTREREDRDRHSHRSSRR